MVQAITPFCKILLLVFLPRDCTYIGFCGGLVCVNIYYVVKNKSAHNTVMLTVYIWIMYQNVIIFYMLNIVYIWTIHQKIIRSIIFSIQFSKAQSYTTNNA